MEHKKTIAYLVILAAIFILLFLTGIFLNQKKQHVGNFYPLSDFTGTIEQINGNKLTIKGLNPNHRDQQVILTETIDSASLINKTSVLIPYLFKQSILPPNSKFDFKDLKTGMWVTVKSVINLDTKELVISNLTVDFFATAVDGTIESISGNTIKLKGLPVVSNPDIIVTSQPQEYDIVVSEDTEISKPPPAPIVIGTAYTPKKYSLSDIKPGVRISVWSDSEISPNQPIKALRIEPFF